MATEAQDELPIFDYHVISEGGPKNRKPGEKPKPEDRWEELVYKEEPPGSKEHGDESIGTAEIHAKGSEADPEFDADFTFTDPPDVRIKVDGKVPGKDKWVGKGKAHAKGEGREDDNIEIEFWNPKRW
jgi:hypothetical protein